ncbi:MAG: methyl-accepting chemotaxis protein, partial [Asticcacaulis sp.]
MQRLSLDIINQKLSVRGRMRIVAALMILPVAITGWLLFRIHMDTIDFSRLERAGSAQLSAVWPEIVAGVLDQPAFSDSLSTLKSLSKGKTAFAAGADLDSLDTLSGKALLDRSLSVYGVITDKSNLTLDPDLDSFYMMDAVTVKLPAVAAAAQSVKAAQAATATKEDRDEAARSFSAALAGLRASLEKSGDNGASHVLAPATASALSALTDAASAFSASPDDSHMTSVMTAATGVFNAGNRDLDLMLARRIAKAERRMITELAVAGAILTLALLVNHIIASGLRRRLTTLSALMQDLISGREVGKIPYETDGHETGIIVKTLTVFRQTLLETEQMRQVQHQLEEEGINQRRRAMLDLADEFERTLLAIVEDLGHSSAGLGDAAEQLSADADRTAQQSSTAASNMEATSANVQSVASATEEMSASSGEIAHRAVQAAEAAEGATAKAEDARGVVDELNIAAERIGSAVDLIARITAQTNLL